MQNKKDLVCNERERERVIEIRETDSVWKISGIGIH